VANFKIDINKKDIQLLEAAILKSMDKKIRAGHRAVAAGLITDWNSKAMKHLSFEESEGDTNNLVRSVFSSLSDYSSPHVMKVPTPSFHQTRHGGRSRRYAERFGFWSLDKIKDASMLIKHSLNDWTITIRKDDIMKAARFATHQFTSGKRGRKIRSFYYMDTGINQTRIENLMGDFLRGVARTAKRYAQKIFDASYNVRITS